MSHVKTFITEGHGSFLQGTCKIEDNQKEQHLQQLQWKVIQPLDSIKWHSIWTKPMLQVRTYKYTQFSCSYVCTYVRISADKENILTSCQLSTLKKLSEEANNFSVQRNN